MLKKFIIISLVMAAGLAAYAKDITSKPMLRINTTMHTARILRLDTDAKGRYVVTASEDKTARLWDARTGDLIRIYRPPIDTENEGLLYSCAISPDGKIIAVGGWTGYDWFKKNIIYLFNASTGEMIRKLPDLGNAINDLRFSPDGKYLAACLGRDAGVSLFETSGWKEIHLDGYEDNVNKCSFYKNKLFVTVSYDGKIRLYDLNKLPKPVLTGKLTGGKQAYNVAFSPDGKKIGVGYSDYNRIQVLDASDLSVLYEPDCSGATDYYNLSKVCWSQDGSILYSGGKYVLKVDNEWWYQIRKWSNGGKGSYEDFSAAYNTILDMKCLPDDTIIYSGYTPDWGRMDPNGKKLVYNRGETFSLNSSDTTHLKMSDDGGGISFTPVGDSTYTFTITDRKLLAEKSDYLSPIDSMDGVDVTDWKNTIKPKLNGKKLTFLDDYELSRCYAVHPSGEYVLFGADWNLYYVDNSGTQVWKTPVPATVWSINIARSKDVCAAALGDGTIHWYRLKDGHELYTLYINSVTKKWVLWTPSGYYDCSTGGDNLIGWHINNGIDKAADFYSASRFANKFYRPDIIPLVLNYVNDTDFEAKALDAANADKNIRTTSTEVKELLPPVVTILNPDSGTTIDNPTFELEISVRTPENTTVSEIKTLVNGRPVVNNMKGLTIKPVKREGDTKTVSVTVPEGESEISVLAKNDNSWSEPAIIKVNYKGKKTEDEFIIKPKLYILAIGVSRYQNKDIQLKYPAKDAKDFANAMLKQKGGLYRDVVEKVVTDEDATKDNILDALDWIQKETTSKDVAMVFLSGHGVNDPNGFFYYLPVNVDLDKLKRSGVAFSDIKNTIASISGKTIFFVDACHSGNVMGSRKGLVDINGIVNELAAVENGAVVFTSSTGNQFSLESDAWGNGAFTKALIEAVNGKADYTGKGKITVNMIDLYISERVKELTKGAQTPSTTKPQTIPDFPVVIK